MLECAQLTPFHDNRELGGTGSRDGQCLLEEQFALERNGRPRGEVENDVVAWTGTLDALAQGAWRLHLDNPGVGGHRQNCHEPQQGPELAREAFVLHAMNPG
jgi:hypothetical protein